MNLDKDNFKVLDVKEKSGNIYLIGRDENNNRLIKSDKNNFYPSHGLFYVVKDKVQLLKELDYVISYTIFPTSKKSLFGEELLEVRFKIDNFDRIKEFRSFVNEHKMELLEADLFGRTLYCLDILPNKGFSLEGKWRLGYIDIETEATGEFHDASNPVDRVLCMSCYDNYTEKYQFFYIDKDKEKMDDYNDVIYNRYDNEVDMLYGIINYFIKTEFDVITGWNVNFDVSYLLRRFLTITNDEDLLNKLSPLGYWSYNEQYKQFNIWGLIIFDLLESYKRIVRNEMISFKLDNVAEEELGENKVEVDVKKLNILPKSELFKYNKKDVELCVKLDKKVNIFNFFDGLRQFVGCPMDDVKYSRGIIDFVLLKKARQMGVVLPSASSGLSSKHDFEGAYVDAVQGSYTNVIAFDIKALYPNIIKTFNLSVECIKSNGSVKLPELNISLEKEGILPNIVSDLIQLRQKYDEERDNYPAGHPLFEKNDILVESAKLVVDAIYGICAFPGFRLYKPEIASTITYLGRQIITHTKSQVESLGHKVVVTDTDSSYFLSSKIDFDDVVKEGKEVLELVNKEYIKWTKETWGIEKCYLLNVFKKIYRRLIVNTKKRYGGHVVWAKGKLSDKIEVVGLECKRSDYSRFAKDFQYSLLKLLLNDESNSVVEEFLLEKIDEMKKLRPVEMGIPTKIEKDIDDYTTNLPKVRGTKYSSKVLGLTFYPGDKPLLLFTEGESDVILYFNDKEGDRLLQNVKIDWVKMTERNILMPAEALLESDGRKWILDGINKRIKLDSVHQKVLSDYFGG